MAIIYPLPKILDSDWSPKAKPKGLVEIDLDNWAAQIMELGIIFNGVSSRDITGKHNLTYEQYFPVTPSGGNLVLDATTDSLGNNITITPSVVKGVSDAWSLVYRAKTTGTDKGMFTGLDGDNTQFVWLREGNFTRVNSGGNNYSFNGTTSFTTTRTYVLTTNGGGAAASTLNLYVDGVADTPIAAAQMGMTVDTILNCYGSTSFNFVGEVEFYYLINKELSAEQALDITRDPYQVVKPSVPSLYFVSSNSDTNISASTDTLTITTYAASVDIDFPIGTAALAITTYPATVTSPAATAASGGTAANVSEALIVSTGGTITITLTNDTFIAAGTGPIGTTAQSDTFVAAITSAQAEAGGWNATVRDVLDNTDLARTSDTVATLTVPATAGYDITATETITPVIQAAILTTSTGNITASSFQITAVVVANTWGIGGTDYWASVFSRVPGEHIQDAEKRYLLAAGGTASSNVDMWRELLTAAGYTGTVQDMKQQWIAAGLPAL